MNPEQKKQLINALEEKIHVISCPMCHEKSFTVADGYAMNQLQDDYRSLVISGEKLVPSVYLICNNCGFISQHALGALESLQRDNG